MVTHHVLFGKSSLSMAIFKFANYEFTRGLLSRLDHVHSFSMAECCTGQRMPMMELKPAPMYFNEVVFLGLAGPFAAWKKHMFPDNQSKASGHQVTRSPNQLLWTRYMILMSSLGMQSEAESALLFWDVWPWQFLIPMRLKLHNMPESEPLFFFKGWLSTKIGRRFVVQRDHAWATSKYLIFLKRGP